MRKDSKEGGKEAEEKEINRKEEEKETGEEGTKTTMIQRVFLLHYDHLVGLLYKLNSNKNSF